MDKASAENDASMITHNRKAQHKYLTWRAEKVVFFFFPSTFSFIHTICMIKLIQIKILVWPLV